MTYTIFAIYSPDVSCTGSENQPYATTVVADTPELALEAAQEQCRVDNGRDVSDSGWDEPLVGIQVVAGLVEVLA